MATFIYRHPKAFVTDNGDLVDPPEGPYFLYCRPTGHESMEFCDLIDFIKILDERRDSGRKMLKNDCLIDITIRPVAAGLGIADNQTTIYGERILQYKNWMELLEEKIEEDDLSMQIKKPTSWVKLRRRLGEWLIH